MLFQYILMQTSIGQGSYYSLVFVTVPNAIPFSCLVCRQTTCKIWLKSKWFNLHQLFIISFAFYVIFNVTLFINHSHTPHRFPN